MYDSCTLCLGIGNGDRGRDDVYAVLEGGARLQSAAASASKGGETRVILVRDLPSVLRVVTFDQIIVTMRQLHGRSRCSNSLVVL